MTREIPKKYMLNQELFPPLINSDHIMKVNYIIISEKSTSMFLSGILSEGGTNQCLQKRKIKHRYLQRSSKTWK